MRFTNALRNAIVRAVMRDIPKEDYQAAAESLVRTWHVERMPPKVRAVYDDDALRGLLETVSVFLPVFREWVMVRGVGNAGTSDELGYYPPELVEECRRLYDLHEAQQALFDAAEEKLRQALWSCATTEKFSEQYPELAKYIPQKYQPTENLPVVVNVMDALRNAGAPL